MQPTLTSYPTNHMAKIARWAALTRNELHISSLETSEAGQTPMIN